MPKYQATSYIRLSYTDDRSSESDSVTNQRKLIENFIERNPDIEIISEKIDDGYSGIIFDRPAFKEMMQDITDGKINCVIVKDLSRLGREYIETGRYLRRVFPAYGVRFIAITDNIDTAHENSGDDLTVSVKKHYERSLLPGHFHQNPYLFGYKAAERRFCWGFPCLRLYEVRGKQKPACTRPVCGPCCPGHFPYAPGWDKRIADRHGLK